MIRITRAPLAIISPWVRGDAPGGCHKQSAAQWAPQTLLDDSITLNSLRLTQNRAPLPTLLGSALFKSKHARKQITFWKQQIIAMNIYQTHNGKCFPSLTPAKVVVIPTSQMRVCGPCNLLKVTRQNTEPGSKPRCDSWVLFTWKRPPLSWLLDATFFHF